MGVLVPEVHPQGARRKPPKNCYSARRRYCGKCSGKPTGAAVATH